MSMLEYLLPASSWTTGLITLFFVVGNVVALALMRFTDGDDDD